MICYTMPKCAVLQLTISVIFCLHTLDVRGMPAHSCPEELDGSHFQSASHPYSHDMVTAFFQNYIVAALRLFRVRCSDGR